MTFWPWPTTDLPPELVVAAACAIGVGLVVLAFEVRRHARRFRLLASGMVAAFALAAAIFRPRVSSLAEAAGRAPITVILDDSRSLGLPFDDRFSRRNAAAQQIAALAQGHTVRWLLLQGGSLVPTNPARLFGSPIDVDVDVEVDVDVDVNPRPQSSAEGPSTDFVGAFAALRRAREEPPRAVVVVSDGRQTGPTRKPASPEQWRPELPFDGVPVHTIALGKSAPDAAISSLAVRGSAFAHGPIQVRIEVLCQGLACDSLPITIDDLPEPGTTAQPSHKAVIDASSGRGFVDLTLVYEQPGHHAVQAILTPPEGDSVNENNVRSALIDVRRERVRMLHVAGRPTNDVRALRRFLKGNSSIDLISFFILRTPDDDPRAPASELSLIPFPVDELFEEHLPSFDAVVLQDIDAEEYGLSRHLRRLARYVETGGGLVLVGGPHAFAGGGYDKTSIAAVLPTELEPARLQLQDTFEPRFAAAGDRHPVSLAFNRGGGKLIALQGTSALGAPMPGSLVLWEHPSALTRTGSPMPVLALRDVHGGRTVAVGTDATWRLGFSAEAAAGAGGGYDALWDALIGWTLHDPRFDPSPLALVHECVSGQTLRVARPPDGADGAQEIVRGAPNKVVPFRAQPDHLELAPFASGVHAIVLRQGDVVTAQGRFVCENGGDEWVDVRPDHDVLRAISEASGGTFFSDGSTIDARILPRETLALRSRHDKPWAPSWLLGLLATLAAGLHWFERRRFGLR